MRARTYSRTHSRTPIYIRTRYPSRNTHSTAAPAHARAHALHPHERTRSLACSLTLTHAPAHPLTHPSLTHLLHGAYRHGYPSEESVKATTYGAYSAATRHFLPLSIGGQVASGAEVGGGVDAGSGFIVGGSYWDASASSDTSSSGSSRSSSSPPASSYVPDDAVMRALAEAGLVAVSLVVDVSTPGSTAVALKTLTSAAKYGVFVLAAAATATTSTPPDGVSATVAALSCHTNFGGFVHNATAPGLGDLLVSGWRQSGWVGGWGGAG
jgi:hypothetical protein